VALYTALTAAFAAAAFTYFFKQWAFSRFVVLWFGGLMTLAMPAWRIFLRNLIRKRPSKTARSFIRRKALIVGTDETGRRLGRKLMEDETGELEPVGFADFDEKGAGNIIEGIPVLGSTRELDRIIETESIQELIFSTDRVPYERIIELIQSLQVRNLNFRVVPTQKQSGDEELTFLRVELAPLRGFKPWRGQARAFIEKIR